jgi:hypothetical protein
MTLDVKAAIKERCRNLSFAIATSQDGGAIRDMEQRLAEAQAELRDAQSDESPRSSQNDMPMPDLRQADTYGPACGHRDLETNIPVTQ